MTDFPTNQGFTLPELLITILITLVLSSIAYPSYQSYMTKARRSFAKIALYDLANKLERYHIEHQSYQGATLENLYTAKRTESSNYSLWLKDLSQSTYTIEAHPEGKQAKQDVECGNFSLNNIGQRGISGKATINQCWS